MTQDAKLCFFAQSPSSPTPYRVTVDMGAARNFGISAGGDNPAVANNPQQQPPQPQPTQQQPAQPTQPQQAQTQPPPQQPDTVTKAQHEVDKAKAAGQELKNLFHHH